MRRRTRRIQLAQRTVLVLLNAFLQRMNTHYIIAPCFVFVSFHSLFCITNIFFFLLSANMARA